MLEYFSVALLCFPTIFINIVMNLQQVEEQQALDFTTIKKTFKLLARNCLSQCLTSNKIVKLSFEYVVCSVAAFIFIINIKNNN